MAKDLKIKNIHAIANKVRSDADSHFIRENLKKEGLELVETIPFSSEILNLDKVGDLSGISGDLIERMRNVENVFVKRV